MLTSSNLPVYLFVLPWPLQDVGGVNQVVINLARQMALEGTYKPVVLATDWTAKHPTWEAVHGVQTVRWQVRGPASGLRPKQRLAHLIWQLRFAPAFRAFCRQHNVAVINPHFPTEVTLTLAALSKRWARSPRMIVSFHGADLTGLQTSPSTTLLAWRDLLQSVHAVVACSSALGQKVAGTFQRAPTVVHNGIDAPAFIAMAGLPCSRARRFILSVGKFEHKKGQDLLIRAFAMLAPEYDDVDLVLIGATDSALQPLKQLCLQIGIADRVEFRPDTPHAEVARFFASASVFALPSRHEPFGIVLLEAGCLALPVVACAVGGVPEILDDGVTALLVAPDQINDLRDAVRTLLDDPESARAMGERLRLHVAQNFSWKHAHERYVQLANA